MRAVRAPLLLVTSIVVICGACEKAHRATSPSGSPSPPSSQPQVVTTASGIEMVLIPAGTFVMGSEQGEPDQQPGHEVQLDSFLIDRYEVTQTNYAKLDPINGSHFKGPELPTEMIGWGKAALYCNLRSEAEGLEPCYDEFGECNFQATGYRLPTEAEWEYACRAGSDTAYSFGSDQAHLPENAWFKSNSSKKTHAVGKKLPNAWGLYDMHGNVAEWCNDFYAEDYYRQSPTSNPTGPSEGEKNVLRGGHWGATATVCQTAYRMSEEPGFSDACFARDAIGFRCVRRAPADQVSQQTLHNRRAIADTPYQEPFSNHGCVTPTSLLALLTIPSYLQDSASHMDTHQLNNPVGFVYSDIYLQHETTAGHPERKERLTAILAQLEKSGLSCDLVRIAPRAAEEKWLTTVHTARYVQSIRRLCELQGGYAGSPDTPVSQQSYRVAVHAAGGTLAAVDAVMAGKVKRVFCAIRPPGHHATRDRAMGFCLFNNVAIAARYIQQQHHLKRVLIVDWDVHHGNGTEAIFLEDPSIFYFGIHQSPFYPGTGSAEQRGAGEGIGSNLNVPLPAGSGDAEFRQAIEKELRQAATEFKPDFVLISAGFDAHKSDPLGGMKVTTEGFAHMTRAVKGIADTYCQSRLVSLLEGGYDLEGLSASVETHLRVLGE